MPASTQLRLKLMDSISDFVDQIEPITKLISRVKKQKTNDIDSMACCLMSSRQEIIDLLSQIDDLLETH